MDERALRPEHVVDERLDGPAAGTVGRLDGDDIGTELGQQQPRELTSLIGQVEDSVGREHEQRPF